MATRKLPIGGKVSQAEIDPELAIATIGIFSALADGKSFNEEESYGLDEVLSYIDLFEDYSDEEFEELGADVGKLMQAEGVEASINGAIAALTEEDLQEVGFVTALLMVAIDGEVPEAELEYLEQLRQALHISDDRAQEIIDELSEEFDEDFEEEEEK